ncbi:MAG: cytochrome c3 family protein [Bryobacteraceae bacterium]
MKGKTEEHACASCHLEHLGRAFVLIKWDPRKFDHREAGYQLEGAHAKLDCRQCHQPKFISDDRRIGIRVKDLRRSYLGLDSNCVSCHTDPHRNTLDSDCRKCHTMDNWKATPGFDHGKTRFSLTGKHAAVACAQCHKPSEGGPAKNFRGLSTICESCHKDPHNRAFFEGCGACHTTSNWKERLDISRAFSHDNTSFHLRGKHVALQCGDCHKDKNFGAKIAHAACLDCHKDKHRNQFAARADKGDCGSCHTVDGYTPATFYLEHHQKTSYPLLGMHSGVDCARCHPGKGADIEYHPQHGRCLDCHKDAHDGQLNRAASGGECGKCHTVESFTPSSYTLTMHSQSRFTLKGAHAAVPCDSCHKTTARKPEKVNFHFAALECKSCHRDPHDLRMPLECNSCHAESTWRRIAAFDHSRTRFALKDAHTAATCQGCHKPQLIAAAKGLASRRVIFHEAGSQCGDCHEDVHGGQFARDGRRVGCEVCHTGQSWRPPLFDHDKSTSFSLSGAHSHVPCRQCHATMADLDGRQVRQYRTGSRRCEDCH